MNKNILLDSDVIIWLLRDKKEIVEKFRTVILNNTLFVTPVTVAEIFSGARKDELKKIHEFFDLVRVIEINFEIGKIAGEFIRQFSKSHSVEIADALIAASSKYYELKLWTLNTKHYPMLNNAALF
ncbi:MAG: type II toxin-antitoxin system VapC family toxin [Bacteroidota bacterium]